MSQKERDKKFTRRDFNKMVGYGFIMAAVSACKAPLKNKSQTLEGILKATLTDESISSPEPTKTSTPEPTPDVRTYFEKYVYPALKKVAVERRNNRAAEDPNFWHRVDKELNENRVNFALLGIGSERVLTDSNQILSLDLDSGEIRIVSLYRAVQAPEISRYNNTTRPYYASQALHFGGIPLVETVLESATGLSADFAIALHMDVLARGVETVFDDQLEVCIPWVISDLNMGYFDSGLQNLTGDEVLRISRARYYGTDFDRQAVQQYVLRAMFRRARNEIASGPIDSAKLVAKGLSFLNRETKSGDMRTNFDNSVFVDIGIELVNQITASGLVQMESYGMPYLAARHALAAEHMGDPNDIHRRRPPSGDPHSEDLVTGYWFSSREETKKFLTSPLETTGYEYEDEVCTVKK
jgi:hypothetical protein